MALPGLTSLRLTRFKSHRNQVLNFEPVTLIIGRNGSGKSNVLDALSLLALLADDRDVSDLERGDQEVAGLRGGLSGAAPFGDARVRIGCTIQTASGELLDFDIDFDAGERPEIVKERLVLHRRTGRQLILIEANWQGPGSGISDVQTYSGGAPRSYHFLSSRLATAQAITKVPTDTRARQLVVDSCTQLAATLRGVFVLDPVPAAMRGYIRIGSAPDRSGSTTSALAYDIRGDHESWSRLNELVSALVETQLEEITFLEGRLPGQPLVDVMVALREKAGNQSFTAPARVMSDGTLRYLSIVSTMLALRSDQPAQSINVRRTLLVEEVENGLFPSQGERVMELLRSQARAQDIRLVATTHSPALLDALEPSDHRGVIVCDRSDRGWSRLRALTDHPRYVEIAGGGAVGRSVTRGLLSTLPPTNTSLSDLFR